MKKFFGGVLVMVAIFALLQFNIIKINFGDASTSTEVAIKASAPAVKVGDTLTLTVSTQAKLFTLDYVLYLDGLEFARTDGTGTFTKSKTNELFKFVSSVKDGDRMQIVLKSLKAGNAQAKFGLDGGEATPGSGLGTLTLKTLYSPEINLTVTD